MVLPASGNPLSLNQLHIEAGGTSGTECSLNDADIRQIIGVASDGSQNIQQYYGQSSSFASFDEVVTADNTGAGGGATGSRYVSFPGGVSDGDIIIAFSYDSGNATSANALAAQGARLDLNGYYVTAPSAHHTSNIANAYSMWYPHAHTFDVYVQSIICNSSTANSFYWTPNDTYGSQCQLVMVKYSSNGATNASYQNFVGGGTNAIGNYSSSLAPFTVISGNQTIQGSSIHSSTVASSQSVISVMVKGGDMTSSHYATFSTAGDASAVITDNGSRPTTNFQNQAHGHTYALQYYTKQEDKPSSGGYSDITVSTNGTAGGGFAYYHFNMVIY